MSNERKPHLPIGYWLKKADELLTACINKAQEANGLSRTEWQILNTLHEMSATTRSRVIEILHPFGNEKELASAIEGLRDRGLVEEEGSENGRLRLTAQGRAVHGKALEVQKQVRQRAVEGITEAEYATAVRVLQQIVANLSDGEI